MTDEAPPHWEGISAGQELRPQKEPGSRRATRHDGRPPGEVDPGVSHRHVPPCLLAAGAAGIHRQSRELWRECRNAGPACQQECWVEANKGIREYCLRNHIECENLNHVPIDPKPCKQRHREVHHLLRTIDDNRSAFEAAKPMPLSAMVPLDAIRVDFAHDQSLRGKHRGICLPMIGAVECHVPLGQAIDPLL
jgi:hypothetical protein